MPSARSIIFFLAVLAIGGAVEALAQGSSAPSSAPVRSVARTAPSAPEGVRWSSLNPAQQTALKPLAKDWDSIDGARKDKWVTIANRFPNMSANDRARVQTRMEDWAKLSPKERGQARMNYREVQQMPAQERKDRWEAYQALPPEEQKKLATRAAPATRKPGNGDSAVSQKSNVVPNPSLAPRPKPIAPTVTQAAPGATTNLITKRAAPPPHQQTGMPKIAASPGFVDQSTLLPKRGPQGAAIRPVPSQSASASLPAKQP